MLACCIVLRAVVFIMLMFVFVFCYKYSGSRLIVY